MTIMNFQTLFNNTGYILKKEEMRLGLYQQYFSYIAAVFELTTFVMYTDYTGCCKSNDHDHQTHVKKV